MSVGTRQVLQVVEQAHTKMNLTCYRLANIAALGKHHTGKSLRKRETQPRVFVASENRLLQKRSSRALVKTREL